jgi:hypothetical protein
MCNCAAAGNGTTQTMFTRVLPDTGYVIQAFGAQQLKA